PSGVPQIVHCAVAVPLRHLLDNLQRVNRQLSGHPRRPRLKERLGQHIDDTRHARVLDLGVFWRNIVPGVPSVHGSDCHTLTSTPSTWGAYSSSDGGGGEGR